jgi:adenine-specific DNA-methyltransferase
MARKKKDPTPVPPELDANRHHDTRKNIPTEELRDFVADAEAKPKTMLYPRDPSLDPQLVWKGKDEQDREPLEVDIVPIYIQEVIEPRVIIDAVQSRKRTKPETSGFLPGFFDDFDAMDFDRKIEFYQHDQKWANRMILGNSLHVMTSLAEKGGLKGKVQMIYIDPPYGIKFGSNWQVSTRKRDVKDGKAEDATRQPEQVRAFRDTWKLGIHSYLALLRDWLQVARELLTETGSIFVQIGDENVHLVRCLLDDVLGSEQFQAQINFKSKSPLGRSGLPQVYDYIIWYSKSSDFKFKEIFKQRIIEGNAEWKFIDDPGFHLGYRVLDAGELERLGSYDGVFRRSKLTSSGFTTTCTFEFSINGVTCKPYGGKSWVTNREGIETLKKADRLFILSGNAMFKQYFNDFPVEKYDNCWPDQPAAESRSYVVETSPKYIERCLQMTTDPGDLVLDPTCGSGTTACVAEQWGRRWITIDTSRVALALARTRLMAARFPYYYLADSCPQMTQMTADEDIKNYLRQSASSADKNSSSSSANSSRPPPDIRKGFVYKRVPHVTLKSIANNPDIKEGMTRAQIDAAIRRHAETETLHDQPYEDQNRIRVSGPFTVESLSPDRIVSTDEERPASELVGQKHPGRADFATMILDNLRKAGVQNTFKNERLKFDRLECHAGAWIHATGDYTNGDGKPLRIAVTIGPEYGTVTPQQVKEAAKEAVSGIGFDILIVCGFAFDPHVSEEAKRYGKLTVLPARMNPDLLIGDTLKNTGAGNLFMIFGEPDIAITRDADGRLVVEVEGVDVYDPTTGQIRSSSTDDIACWFIDTDYDGECFFVRHAYFLGADDPYGKLKRALRAEIDEAQWATLYSTKSYPFESPSSGKIAVKVINHYGDEVLKVYKV